MLESSSSRTGSCVTLAYLGNEPIGWSTFLSPPTPNKSWSTCVSRIDSEGFTFREVTGWTARLWETFLPRWIKFPCGFPETLRPGSVISFLYCEIYVKRRTEQEKKKGGWKPKAFSPLQPRRRCLHVVNIPFFSARTQQPSHSHSAEVRLIHFRKRVAIVVLKLLVHKVSFHSRQDAILRLSETWKVLLCVCVVFFFLSSCSSKTFFFFLVRESQTLTAPPPPRRYLSSCLSPGRGQTTGCSDVSKREDRCASQVEEEGVRLTGWVGGVLKQPILCL